MILVDYSSIIHRMIHTSIKDSKPKKINGQFNTKEFVNLTKHLILQELFNIQRQHSPSFGDLIICLDDKQGYWRRDVFSAYKAHRRKDREESEINYSEVFDELDSLVHQIKENLPWKTLLIPRAEADDTILVLAKEFYNSEKILIHSPDKDMIQAQRNNDTVFQYSSLTKKWIVPENKHDNMDHWIQEHVIFGDSSDGVPKVVDGTEFSDNFKKHLEDCDVPPVFHDVYTFKYGFKDINGQVVQEIPKDKKIDILEAFTIEKINRKGESTGVKDVYKDMRFGTTTLEKAVQKHGSVEKFIDSNPLYREHYDRNFILVMEEGILVDIWNQIILEFKTAKYEYNKDEFIDYLNKHMLKSIEMDLPLVFRETVSELTADNCGW